MKQLATIYINDLHVDCILGVGDAERSKLQTVSISIEIVVDAATAVKTDAVDDTVNYSTLSKEVVSVISQSSFHLLESMASSIVDICLGYEKTVSVTVKVTKLSRNVTVEMKGER